MALPRSTFVSTETTPYYHVISRCVRQSFLCGRHRESGKSYEHRRAWIENRLLFLSSVFTIDLCAYGIMHNHYHITLHIKTAQALSLSDREVIERWHKIYRGTALSQRYINENNLSPVEQQQLEKTCKEWRGRLHSISWFMRCCNEYIARRANREDDCKGHFWDGRFKSIAILDYRALIATMVYNDLNPLKAGIASDIESSHFTSIKKRLLHARSAKGSIQGLVPFKDQLSKSADSVLPLSFSDYLQMINWSAAKLQKKAVTPSAEKVPQFLATLGLTAEQWTDAIGGFEHNFKRIAGTHENIKSVCKRLNRRWMQGISACQRCFDTHSQDSNPLMSKMLAEPPISQM